MADPITLEVRCRDASGAAYAVDKVILDYGEGSALDEDTAPFEFQAHKAFEGAIKVQKAGFPDWTFPLRVLEAKGATWITTNDRRWPTYLWELPVRETLQPCVSM